MDILKGEGRFGNLLVFPVFILFAFMSFAKAHIAFEEQPADTKVAIGSSATFRCKVGRDFAGANVFWWTGTSHAVSQGAWIIPSYLTADQISRYSIIGNFESGEFNLHIKNITEEDSNTYYCRFMSRNKWFFSRQARLQVIQTPPVSCRVQTTSSNYEVGDAVTLSCRSYSSSENVEVMWTRRGEQLPGCQHSSNRTTSVVEYVLKKQDYDVPFVCREQIGNQSTSCQVIPLQKPALFVNVSTLANTPPALQVESSWDKPPKTEPLHKQEDIVIVVATGSCLSLVAVPVIVICLIKDFRAKRLQHQPDQVTAEQSLRVRPLPMQPIADTASSPPPLPDSHYEIMLPSLIQTNSSHHSTAVASQFDYVQPDGKTPLILFSNISDGYAYNNRPDDDEDPLSIENQIMDHYNVPQSSSFIINESIVGYWTFVRPDVSHQSQSSRDIEVMDSSENNSIEEQQD